MLQTPFYDPLISYEDNYQKGPFGAFADEKVYVSDGEPIHDFLGHKIYTPFGIPAGPLLNSNFVKAAFEKGFDICVYKTVRSDTFPCHPHPNVLSVEINGDLTIERAKRSLVATSQYDEPLSITNSFGVPSRAANIWIDDVKKAVTSAGKGQVLVLSFMGTVRPGQSHQQFVDDHKLAAEQSMETGAKILEVNLSCPNLGNEGLLCYDLKTSEEVLKAIRAVIGKTPLVVKIGYFEDVKQLEEFAGIANEYAQDISGINTIPAPIVDNTGAQALPGSPLRLRSARWRGRARHVARRSPPRLRGPCDLCQQQGTRVRLSARPRRQPTLA
jgi:dihydroorotate dehydrogenase